MQATYGKTCSSVGRALREGLLAIAATLLFAGAAGLFLPGAAGAADVSYVLETPGVT